ncbi:MAG: 2-oxo-4-hydroxy-4-carboxy-5-ureidoimidazoline decarboxylase [Hydrogenophaga sp.]|uniref:2-oxo-4-hydroxy-4-carboxy-5-ureidoimidazoline decarboxylase n=1 Tax=Hydrogenophaga sp. TaxID=1904254 RepID=UPI0025C1D828|nr:2-oxo-4-hydroxy-4-carboxy-5-ureidoimidazoline decarboxylase [Hydrogenophaga sp.]MBU7574865.1 2-oxo-4-hydroxy-4-carboxy-5-ureidoimidazoline decarboxylase [Hydrogenophaga sp.]
MNTPTPSPLAWNALALLDEATFCARLGPVVEHSPWVAREAWAARPFADWASLCDSLSRVIHGADEARQLALLRSHPELAGQEARAGTMTADSQSEQGRLGLLALDAATVQRIESLNRRYRERFGFPFIVALRLHGSLATVLQAGEARLANDALSERRNALQQVCEVMRGRLAQTVSPEPSPPPSPSVNTLAGTPS